MLRSWKRTWTGGSVWSKPLWPATSPNRSCRTTAASSAPDPPFWFASDTLTTSSGRRRSNWHDWLRACHRSWQRLVVGQELVSSHYQAPPPALLLFHHCFHPLWFQAPPTQSGPPPWHHFDVIAGRYQWASVKDGERAWVILWVKGASHKGREGMKPETFTLKLLHTCKKSLMCLILFTPSWKLHVWSHQHQTPELCGLNCQLPASLTVLCSEGCL